MLVYYCRRKQEKRWVCQDLGWQNRSLQQGVTNFLPKPRVQHFLLVDLSFAPEISKDRPITGSEAFGRVPRFGKQRDELALANRCLGTRDHGKRLRVKVVSNGVATLCKSSRAGLDGSR